MFYHTLAGARLSHFSTGNSAFSTPSLESQFLATAKRPSTSHFHSHHSARHMEPRLYTCGLPDESIEEYKPGGYHPVRLGDAFRNGRYRILHKLGWGSYSTTWLARDDVENRNVALKVSSVDASKKLPGEKEILRALAALAKSHPGHSHIVSLLDSFTVNGPNGAHSCLVLELLGPSVHETNLHIFMNYAFPAPTVKRLAAQILSVIDLMSRHDIGHGGE